MGFCIFLLTVGLRAAPTVMRLPGPAVASGVGGSPGFPTPTERPGPGGPGQADLPEPHAEARAGVQPAARHSGGESRSPDRLSSESKSRSAHVRARAHKRATTSARPPADHGGCSHRSASSEQGNRAGTRVFGFRFAERTADLRSLSLCSTMVLRRKTPLPNRSPETGALFPDFFF